MPQPIAEAGTGPECNVSFVLTKSNIVAVVQRRNFSHFSIGIIVNAALFFKKILSVPHTGSGPAEWSTSPFLYYSLTCRPTSKKC